MKTQRRFGGVVGGVALALLAINPAFAQGAGKPADPKAATKPADAKAAAKPADPKAAAADPKTDPRAKYNAAVKKFEGGDYAGALADFQELDAIKSTPQSTRYIALAQDKLGRFAEAVAAYEKFVASPGKLTKEAEEARKRVEEIKKMPGKLHVETTPPGATITVDGKTSGTSPAEIELAPGKHVVRVELAGYLPLDRDVEIGYGAKQDVKAELEAKPAEPPPPPVAAEPPPEPEKPAPPPAPPQTPKSKLPAFITGGIAIAALGVGIGFGAAALGKQSEFNSNPKASTADEGENFALVADMMFGVAITLGVASAVLFFTKDDDPAAPAKAQIVPKPQARRAPVTLTPTPFVTPHGGGAGALIRF